MHFPLQHTKFILALAVAAGLQAQDAGSFFSKFQVHGNVAQGLLFSDGNNYMTTYSSNGSMKWTDGSLSVARPITDKFRVGAQIRSYSFGQIGKQNVRLDWAYADYRANPYFGVRVGRVKTPFGLYNDVQDIDAIHQWALLPPSLYSADNRSFSLAHYGAVIYGSFSPSKHLGSIEYQAFGGARTQGRGEGLDLVLAAQGFNVGSSVGPIAGLDLRWRTPLPGFVLGAAYSKVDLDAPDARIGSFPLPINSSYNQRQLFAQYEHGKLTLTTEWRVNPVHTTMGQGPTNYTPMRSWYAMASYRVATKLVLGAYYDTELAFFSGGRDRNDPGNYAKDVTVNSRFDFNRYLYCKLEGHFIHGNTVGFYPQTNPDGFTKNTKLLVARVGVSF